MVKMNDNSKETLGRIGDRCSERAYFHMFFLLIISFLAFSILPNFLKAQKTNVLAFEDLVSDFVSNHPKKIDTLKGFLTEDLKSRIFVQAASPFALNIDPPVVTFKSMGKNQFQRKIAAVLTYQDSTEHVYALTYCDTLAGNQIGKVRKSKLSELRGTDPRWTSKFLFPGTMIGIGIAGIISLFYIRSS